MVARVAIGYPYDIGGRALVGPTASMPTPGFGFGGIDQVFATVPLPNYNLALYSLRIVDPDTPGTPRASFIFPLTPSSVTKEFTSMTNIYDVAGKPSQNGVTRVVDLYGNSPVTFSIEGTTGWQRHSADGFALTGLEAIAAIEGLLNQFAALNRQQQLNNNTHMFSLEFYDFFKGDFWEVVPIGRQAIRITQQRPLLYEYSFRLAGVRDIAAIPYDTTPDAIQNTLSASGDQATSTLNQSLTQTLDNYADTTAGSLGVVP